MKVQTSLSLLKRSLVKTAFIVWLAWLTQEHAQYAVWRSEQLNALFQSNCEI